LIKIEPKSFVPIYEQIKQEIKIHISLGILKPHKPLPSIRDLAAELIVNPNTVARAYRELEREGFIYTKKAKGCYISEISSSLIKKERTEILNRIFDEAIGDQKIEFKHSAYKKEIGYIPEESFFYSWMTIKDLLDLNSSFYPKWNSKKAHEFLERFSLDNKVRIRTLSRGMKLKLGLIVALASEPELLILDDPTSGIDVPTRQDFLKGIIRELSEAGTTILFSTHLIHELEKIVDHLSILHNRHLILDEDYQKVKNAAKRVRITFKDSFPENIGIDGVLKEQREGNIADLVIYPWDKVMEKQIEALSPIRWDIEPLSLEEIFISFVSKNEK